MADLTPDDRERVEAEVRGARWKDAVVDAAVVGWTYRHEHEDDPRAAVNALLAHAGVIALDPAVSPGAAALIAEAEARGRAEGAKWRDKAPTVEGSYWWRGGGRDDGNRPEVVRVYPRYGGEVVADRWDHGWTPVRLMPGQWSGPILPPEGTTDHA